MSKRDRTPERRGKRAKKKIGRRVRRRIRRKELGRLAVDPLRPVHRRLGGQALEGGGSLELHR